MTKEALKNYILENNEDDMDIMKAELVLYCLRENRLDLIGIDDSNDDDKTH